jgi:SOS-response transcriptional repressor LexA
MRQWIANPSKTIAVRMPDDSMHPVLPAGTIALVDRSVTDPHLLSGTIVAAQLEGTAMIRWLDISGRHLILRPNHPARDFPIIPVENHPNDPSPVIGQVVCSWNRFRGV